MHKKSILIILAVTLLAHANVLFNDFVGDDEVVIVKNKFYRSLDNIPRLLTKEYLTQDVNIFISTEEDKRSGSVAYRPVLSLTFFFDYFVWKLNPFGYHLTNLILHIANAIFVFLIVVSIMGNTRAALLSAVLFAAHPVQSEAVCNIGYRADTLSCFFVLLSVLLFIRFRDDLQRGRRFLYLSWGIFFLALFTKESAIVLPVLVIVYDWFFKEGGLTKTLRGITSRYAGYFLIIGFYLPVYFFVFRNPSLNASRLLGGGEWAHVMTMAEIFLKYLINFFLPFTVNILPPLYAPSLDGYSPLNMLIAVLVFASLVYVIIQTYRHAKPKAFFLVWFLVAFAPVSNIVPVPNPMAHRFLYLPSIGLLTFLAIGIDQMCSNPKNFQRLPKLTKIVPLSIVGLCLSITIPLNQLWQNNYTVAAELIRNYPHHAQGYLIMGLRLFKFGLIEETKLVMNRALELGLRDPRVYHVLGISYSDQPDVAEKHFQSAIREFPQYALSYSGVGRLYLFQGKTTKALPYFKKSLELSPTYTGYGYMIQCLLLLNRMDEAMTAYQEAKNVIQHEGHRRSLENMIKLKDQIKEPIDIGL